MRALVLSGGASAGAYQLGVIKALWAKGNRWDVVIGTSVGAINGFGLSYGLTPSEIETEWKSIRSLSDISRFNLTLPWKMAGLFNFEPLRNWLHDISFGRSTMLPSYSCFLDFKTGVVHYQSALECESIDEQIECVLASCAVAGLHIPYNGYCLDGGHVEFAPVSYAVDVLKADQVDVVLTHPLSRKTSEWEPWKTFPLISVILRFMQ